MVLDLPDGCRASLVVAAFEQDGIEKARLGVSLHLHRGLGQADEAAVKAVYAQVTDEANRERAERLRDWRLAVRPISTGGVAFPAG